MNESPTDLTFPPYTLTGGVAYRELDKSGEMHPSSGDEWKHVARDEPWTAVTNFGSGWAKSMKYRRRLDPTPDNYRAMQSAWLSHFNVGVGSRVKIGTVPSQWFGLDWSHGVEMSGKETDIEAILPEGIQVGEGPYCTLVPFHVLAPVEEQSKVEVIELTENESARLGCTHVVIVPPVPKGSNWPQPLFQRLKSGLSSWTESSIGGEPGDGSIDETHCIEFSQPAPHPPAVPEGQGEVVGSFDDFWAAQSEWSQATFGLDGERGPVGALKHLEKEAKEAYDESDPVKQKMEIVDCLFLSFDAARRSGMTPLALRRLAFEKLAINKARKWGKPTSDEPVEHVRDEESPTPAIGQGEERLLYVVMERLPCPESDFVELETASGRGVGPNVGIDWTAYPVGNERTFYRLGPFVSHRDYAELERQLADDDRLQCCNGCRHYTGGDVRHHPSCKWYPESLTKLQDDQDKELNRLRGEVERLTTRVDNQRQNLTAFFECLDGLGITRGLDGRRDWSEIRKIVEGLTADLGRAREALREARALFSMGIEANSDLTTFRQSMDIHAKADPAAKDGGDANVL